MYSAAQMFDFPQTWTFNPIQVFYGWTKPAVYVPIEAEGYVQIEPAAANEALSPIGAEGYVQIEPAAETWTRRHTVKYHVNGPCFCGSQIKYKKCCKKFYVEDTTPVVSFFKAAPLPRRPAAKTGPAAKAKRPRKPKCAECRKVCGGRDRNGA